MTMNGQGMTASTGNPNSDADKKEGLDDGTQNIKDMTINIEENSGKEELQDSKSKNQKDLTSYWTTMKNGPSGEIIKIKEEKVETENRFKVLSEEEQQLKKQSDEDEEKFERENDSEFGDIYGPDEDNFSEEIDTTTYPQLAKNALSEVKGKTIEDLKHHELSETMFTVMRVRNHGITRAEVYKQKTQWLQKALKCKLQEYLDQEFEETMANLATTIKLLDCEDIENKEQVEQLVTNVYNESHLDISKLSDMEMKDKFCEIRKVIELIDAITGDPLTQVPRNIVNLRECVKNDIDEMTYFHMVLAVINEVGESGKIKKLNIQKLYQKAVEVWELHSVKAKQTDGSPPKKSRMESNDESFNTNLTSNKQKSALEQKMDQMKADAKEQENNMKGINIENLTPDESEVSFNFSIKSPPKLDEKVRKVKTVYNLHSRIHVDRNVNAQKVVKMVLKVLRKADPTVLILKYDATTSQNQFIEDEENVPEEESELKKWISVADRQPVNKFVFTMRISITESPPVVKRRIFDWCRGQQHYIDFKKIGSANVFAAGWLFKLHPNQYNRDMLREWMVHNNAVLKNDIHLLPAPLFKDKDEKTSIRTKGIRVEVTFEKKEAVMKELYALKWSEGPYKNALFIPFRKNETYTNDMLFQLMEQHDQYMKKAKQWVFRMKGALWKIEHKSTGSLTTFKSWISKITVNGTKVIDSVEIGDNDYVRLLFHEKHLADVKHIMRKLYSTTEEAFGEEKTKLMFSLDKSPIKDDIYELEQKHAETLSKVLQGNPQNDDDDTIPSPSRVKRQKVNQVYFGTANVDRSYASIAKETQQKKSNDNDGSVKQGSELKKEVNVKLLKEELLKEVKAHVEVKIDNVERKLNIQLNNIQLENNTKIESLKELVMKNQSQTEASLKEQFKTNNADLVAQISNLLGIQNKNNPPNDMVEQGSQSGGSKK